MPLTIAQHQKKTKSPAVCELLSLRACDNARGCLSHY